MVSAVVADLGGVLFSEGKSIATAKLGETHGYDRELIGRMLSSEQAIKLRQGLISDEEFWSWVARQVPSGYDAGLIKKEWYDGYVLDEDILALIRSLRGKHKIIAFSGNIRTRIDYLEQKYHFRQYFDLEIYSFDYHITKPDKRFVEIMIVKAECPPQEIVYIDDNDRYAEPARELGVNVVLYSRGGGDQLRAQLKGLGVKL